VVVNIKDVRKCRDSVELNEFVERYFAEGNSHGDTINSIYWRLYEEWKKSLKKKPARML
jgi:hypothetical protein